MKTLKKFILKHNKNDIIYRCNHGHKTNNSVGYKQEYIINDLGKKILEGLLMVKHNSAAKA